LYCWNFFLNSVLLLFILLFKILFLFLFCSVFLNSVLSFVWFSDMCRTCETSSNAVVPLPHSWRTTPCPLFATPVCR
jgi:hypothetical protein